MQENVVQVCRARIGQMVVNSKGGKFRRDDQEEYVLVTRTLLQSIHALTPLDRNTLVGQLTNADVDFFGSLMMDAAIHSVRANDKEQIGWGLLAMLFSRREYVGSDLWGDFAALHHSAKKLDYDLEGYYRANRELALPEMQKALDGYFARGGMDLSQSGYKEGVTKSGEFTYTFRRSYE